MAGETEMEAPGTFPGIHIKDVPLTELLAINVELDPLQILVGEAEAETAGKGFTVTVTVLLPEHPDAKPLTV